jgi:hypothetical protein
MSDVVEQLQARTSEFLSGTGQEKAVILKAIHKALVKAPDDVRLHRLAGRIYRRECDDELRPTWERVLQLQPGDAEARFELALCTYASAERLVQERSHQAQEEWPVGSPEWMAQFESETQEWLDEFEDDDDDDDQHSAAVAHGSPASASLKAAVRQVEAEGAEGMLSALRDGAANMDLVLRSLTNVENLAKLPLACRWLHYALVLVGRTAHPENAQLTEAEARLLVALCATGGDGENELPPGYITDLGGDRYHAITVAGALAAIDRLPLGATAPGLLQSRGDLLMVQERYAEASAAYRLAADRARQQLEGVLSEHRRDSLGEMADRCQAWSRTCAAGRSAVLDAHFEEQRELALAVRRFNRAFGADEQPPEEMDGMLALRRAKLESRAGTPPAEQVEQLQRTAILLAQKARALMDLQPAIVGRDAHAVPDGIEHRFEEVRADFQLIATFIACFENDANSAELRRPCVGQLWQSRDRRYAGVIETTGEPGETITRLITALADGRIIVTGNLRSGMLFETSPSIDALAVDRDTPLRIMACLHLARLDSALSLASADIVPIESLRQYSEVETLAHSLNGQFRASIKFTDAELRGLNMPFHERFSSLALEAMAALLPQ